MSSFLERQKNLFNTLKDAEEQCGYSTVDTIAEETGCGEIDKRTYRKLKHEMKQFRGKESIFKRQEASIRQCLRAKTKPDYMKHPNKWVYYSLSDVTPDQMSDKANTETALAFIRQMEEQENKNKITEVTDETGAVFKKPMFNFSKTIKSQPEEMQQPVFKSNKIIMPEYVVGVSSKKTNKNLLKKDKSNLEARKVELKLNHLYNDDDDDETT